MVSENLQQPHGRTPAGPPPVSCGSELDDAMSTSLLLAIYLDQVHSMHRIQSHIPDESFSKCVSFILLYPTDLFMAPHGISIPNLWSTLPAATHFCGVIYWQSKAVTLVLAQKLSLISDPCHMPSGFEGQTGSANRRNNGVLMYSVLAILSDN